MANRGDKVERVTDFIFLAHTRASMVVQTVKNACHVGDTGDTDLIPVLGR